MEPNFLKNPAVLKFAGAMLIALACFTIGVKWAGDYEEIFITSSGSPFMLSTPRVSLAPEDAKTYDLASLNISAPNSPESPTKDNPPPPVIQPPVAMPPPPPPLPPPIVPPPVALPPPSPPPAPTDMGILGPDGTMQENFSVGDEGNAADGEMLDENSDPGFNGSMPIADEGADSGKKIKKFGTCPAHLRDYVPCMDNVDAINSLNSTDKGEKFERHCPGKDAEWCCIIPTPPHYKTPITWRRSRDEVWFGNVPHTRLVEDKGGQNWIVLKKDKFIFPGGGTQFIHGANQYIEQMAKMVPEIAWGVRTRVVLDVGCGVASFGAFLFNYNVTTLSIAPKDVHENQIQFALERGVPAMIAAFATRRLLYPSQAFELIHCSRCRIDWTRDGGILLLEVNRLLRAGGYFAWAAQPVYKHEEKQQEIWKEMESLTSRMCWKLLKKDGYIAIWQKPLNNTCYLSRSADVQPPLCDVNDDPDDVWYVPLKACITRLPDNGYGGNVTNWPQRLHEPPERLEFAQVDAYAAKKEIYMAETGYWQMIISSYLRGQGWSREHFRNVLDMRASLGGFATAMIDHNIDAWVMNVVPVSGPNTLPVIYDRGLIGVIHDWCEPFDTYPRTYDLIHAFELFSIEEKRCNLADIMLEMDRILRPGGRVYIRDTRAIINKVDALSKALGWRTRIFDTEEGPFASRKDICCDKPRAHS